VVDIPVEKLRARLKPVSSADTSEVLLPASLIAIDSFSRLINGAVLAFRTAEGNHLFDNLRNGIASERIATFACMQRGANASVISQFGFPPGRIWSLE